MSDGVSAHDIVHSMNNARGRDVKHGRVYVRSNHRARSLCRVSSFTLDAVVMNLLRRPFPPRLKEMSRFLTSACFSAMPFFGQPDTFLAV